MLVAMVLAHLMGDFVLQWDQLARWKSQSLRGVLAHGGIVSLVTLVFCLAFEPAWLGWGALIGLLHTGIDTAWLAQRRLRPRLTLPPLVRLLADQTLHLAVIGVALAASGYLAAASLGADLVEGLQDNRTWVYVLGYVFISMPAWILVEFTVFGLMAGTAPDFSLATNKYVGMLERGVITTLILFGQFALVPLVTGLRLIYETPRAARSRRLGLFFGEFLVSVGLAVVVGLGLRMV
jgi:hypothetical protein